MQLVPLMPPYAPRLVSHQPLCNNAPPQSDPNPPTRAQELPFLPFSISFVHGPWSISPQSVLSFQLRYKSYIHVQMSDDKAGKKNLRVSVCLCCGFLSWSCSRFIPDCQLVILNGLRRPERHREPLKLTRRKNTSLRDKVTGNKPSRFARWARCN